MALNDTSIRNARPRAKPYKMGDAKGLFLLIQPSGGKLWRFKFRFDGKEKKLALGTYPETSLVKARELRDKARIELAEGKDPAREKKLARLTRHIETGNTFKVVAREFFDKRKRDGDRPWSPATLAKNEYLLAMLVPGLGDSPIADIKPIEVLAVLRRIEAKGTLESARRAQQLASGIFRYAVATARLASDPTRDLRGALASPKRQHRAAILKAVQLGGLLRAIDGFAGHWTTRHALLLAPHVFVRPGELRQARWEEFDWDEAVWIIPPAKTKMRKPHAVPLSRQSIAILEELREISGRPEGYLFPSIRTASRPMSENTLNAALRRLGYGADEMTAHGFRSSASTLLNEARSPATRKALWSVDAIERALAHGDSDKVRAAYSRGEHWDERVEMAQWWSDYLDQLRKGADVVPFPDRAAG